MGCGKRRRNQNFNWAYWYYFICVFLSWWYNSGIGRWWSYEIFFSKGRGVSVHKTREIILRFLYRKFIIFFLKFWRIFLDWWFGKYLFVLFRKENILDLLLFKKKFKNIITFLYFPKKIWKVLYGELLKNFLIENQNFYMKSKIKPDILPCVF